MNDREAFYLALYELNAKAIYALEDKPDIAIAKSRLHAIRVLLENELKYLKHQKETDNGSC